MNTWDNLINKYRKYLRHDILRMIALLCYISKYARTIELLFDRFNQILMINTNTSDNHPTWNIVMLKIC